MLLSTAVTAGLYTTHRSCQTQLSHSVAVRRLEASLMNLHQVHLQQSCITSITRHATAKLQVQYSSIVQDLIHKFLLLHASEQIHLHHRTITVNTQSSITWQLKSKHLLVVGCFKLGGLMVLSGKHWRQTAALCSIGRNVTLRLKFNHKLS